MKKLYTLLILMIACSNSFAQLIIEAETGQLTGTQVESSVSGFSGTGYVNGFDTDGDKVDISFNVSTTGTYKVAIRYRADSYKEQKLLLNGNTVGKVILPQTTGFQTADVGGVFLMAGQNKLTVVKDWGYFLLDNFTLTLVPPHDYNVTSNLINTQATPEAVAVWDYLKASFGKKVISGQTDYYDELVAIAGKSPKQRAFDFKSYSQGYAYNWKNGGHTFGWEDTKVTEDIINWYNATDKCGLVSVQWHWHSPSAGNVGKNSFYTDETTFDVRNAVDPSKPEYTQVIEDIDSIATQLKRLQAEGIPVLWRPLHEAGGAWFWWGAQGAEPCLKLYDMMQDRLVNHHKLNNLIWVWSTPEEGWYPGNDKVDVIGYDSYPGDYDYTVQKTIFDKLYAMVDGNKIVAMTENGPIPDVDQMIVQDAMWSYFSTWNDLVVAQNTTAHIKAMFANPLVTTLSDPCGIITSIENKTNNDLITLFPNPTNDILYFTESMNYKVYSMQGQLIYQGKNKEINLSNEPSGLYIVEVENQRIKVEKQ